MFNKKLKREIADLRGYVEARLGRLDSAVGLSCAPRGTGLTYFPPNDSVRGRLDTLEARIGQPEPTIAVPEPTLLERLDKLSKRGKRSK